MSDPSETSSVPPALQELIALFNAELEEVRFPGVDAQTLSAAADAVDEAARALVLAEAAAEAARERLGEAQEALLTRGQRALAYAKIYAEEQPALWARLETLQLPRTARRAPRSEVEEAPAAPRRRGRPPKSANPAGALFVEEQLAPAPAGE